MSIQLQDRVAQVLPSERDVMSVLNGLSAGIWSDAAITLVPALPAFDVVLAPSGVGEAFGEQLATLAEAPLALARRTPANPPSAPQQWQSEHWAVERRPLTGKRRALLVSALLEGGVPELELATLARRAGIEVVGVACAVEFSAHGARSRLYMQAIKVYALLQLAHTPAGLQFERRGAGGDVLMPLP